MGARKGPLSRKEAHTHIGPTSTIITINHNQLGQQGNALIQHLHESGATVGEGVLVCALVLGRLLGGEQQPEKEMAFVQAVLDWAGAYFASGQAN